MGLQSALSTALTGLTAAETSIDVAGNNVANSNTVGFKESDVNFATQFLQTQSIGSAPTDGRGGTNPRQIGLGVKVAEITPDFTQGTIQISSNTLDTAIQGDGFFIVQGPTGERLFTRNGQFKTNANNEIVTITGQRVLGYGIDEDFNIQETTLVPLAIDADSTVARATENVFFTGGLNPDKIQIPAADKAGVIDSAILSDGTKEVPPSTVDLSAIARPLESAFGTVVTGAGSVAAGEYVYKITYVDAFGNESPASKATTAVPVTGASNTINLGTIPATPTGSIYTGIRVYRADASSGAPTANQSFRLVTTLAPTATSYADTASNASIAAATVLDDTGMQSGSYSYYVTYYNSTNGLESRPTARFGPVSTDATGSPRVLLQDLPVPSGNAATGGFDGIRIYRNTSGGSTFRLVESITPAEIASFGGNPVNFVDKASEASIASAALINLNGPAIDTTTPISELVTLKGNTYVRLFDFPSGESATITFTATKGARELATRSLTINEDTPVGELLTFMQQTQGVVTTDSLSTFPTASAGSYGGSIVDSRLRFISNMGTQNELSVGGAAIRLTRQNGSTSTVDLDFDSKVKATGDGATADVIVYSSLGEPLRVRVTTVLEATASGEATFRWIATSDDNASADNPSQTLLGTGVFKTDGNGKMFSQENNEVSLFLDGLPASTPLTFNLDFSRVNGLGNTSNRMNAASQDGFPAGTLASFIITESGRIQGVFSNGSTRDLGQIMMARFVNPTGLQQRGDNVFAVGVNSGDPLIGNPGEGGLGNITAGAVELSNTDIGQNLIELITASTQYRGGARVITSVQELLDELLALRR